MSIFERASRNQIRFQTNKGQLCTEDLWQLSLEDLNSIAVKLNRNLRESSEESFIEEKSSENTTLQLTFDVVKHIIDYKLAMNERSQKAAETRQRNERLQELILQKKDAELADKSIEELEAMMK